MVGKCAEKNGGWQIEASGHRTVGRPQLRWRDLYKDMKEIRRVQGEVAQDRSSCRMNI